MFSDDSARVGTYDTFYGYGTVGTESWYAGAVSWYGGYGKVGTVGTVGTQSLQKSLIKVATLIT